MMIINETNYSECQQTPHDKIKKLIAYRNRQVKEVKNKQNTY